MKKIILISAILLTAFVSVNAQMKAIIKVESVPNEIFFNGNYAQTGSYIEVTFWDAHNSYTSVVPFEGLQVIHEVKPPQPIFSRILGCKVIVRVQTWTIPMVDPSYYGITKDFVNGSQQEYKFKFSANDFRIYAVE